MRSGSTQVGSGIKVILFDVDKVLLYYDADDHSRLISRISGVDYSRIKEYRDTISDMVDMGRISDWDVCWMMQKRFGMKGKLPDYRHFYMKSRYRMRPWKRMLSIANKLHGDYKTGTLSNVGEERNMERKKLLKGAKFDYEFNSCEMNMRKPNLNIYRAALKEMGVKPEEVIFIDDKEKNLKPARKLGMIAIRFTGIKNLRKELSSLGIRIQ